MLLSLEMVIPVLGEFLNGSAKKGISRFLWEKHLAFYPPCLINLNRLASGIPCIFYFLTKTVRQKISSISSTSFISIETLSPSGEPEIERERDSKYFNAALSGFIYPLNFPGICDPSCLLSQHIISIRSTYIHYFYYLQHRFLLQPSLPNSLF